MPHFHNRLEAKDRLSTPPSLLSVLLGDGLSAHPSLHADAVDSGGHALPCDIGDLPARHSLCCVERGLFSTAFPGTSGTLGIDPEGRVVLSEMIGGHAGATTDTVLVGECHEFQIWEPNLFRAHLEEAKLRVRHPRKRLGTSTAATPRPPGARE